jgi:uncharacterized protein
MLLREVRTPSALLFALLSLALVASFAQSQTPHQTGSVTDNGAVLSPNEASCLSQLLGKYEAETTHQIAVLTVATLAGEPIEQFSLRVAKAWALGRKGANNGILLVFAPKQRKVRIELGRSFERYISDARAHEIVSTAMLPAFRKQEYAVGLLHGVEQLMNDGRAFVVPR